MDVGNDRAFALYTLTDDIGKGAGPAVLAILIQSVGRAAVSLALSLGSRVESLEPRVGHSSLGEREPARKDKTGVHVSHSSPSFRLQLQVTRRL